MTNLQKNGDIPLNNEEFIYKPSFKSIFQLKIHSETLSPLKALWGNYLLADNLVHFPSERGAGKTLLGLQICIAISSGWKSFCNEPIEVHGNTLFINCELNEDIISRRIGILWSDPPNKIDQDKYQTHVYTTRKSFDDEVVNIIQRIKEYKPVLVVLDNYRMAFINSDANNNRDVARAMNQILTLKDSMKTSILLTDHTRKHSRNLLTDSDLQSGSGAKSDLTDSDMFLRRSSQNKYYRILKRVKSRNCEEADGAKLLQLNPENLWFESVSENVNEEDHLGENVINDTEEKKVIAKELKEKGKSEREIGRLLSVSKSSVNRWLKE